MVKKYGDNKMSEHFDESNRLFVSRAKNIEFINSIFLINKFMKDGIKILDCSSGPGTYSLYLAKNFNCNIVSTFNLLSVDNVEINIKPINKINNILNNPKISMPLFKYCWIGSYYTFTPSGEIFVCPESCEHHSLKIGNFYPNSYINEQKIKFLLELNALNIDMCKNCYFAPICGSGCYIRRIANQNICYKKDIYQSLQTQINNIEKRKKS